MPLFFSIGGFPPVLSGRKKIMALQTELKPEDWRFCVAPMIDWTDEWCRHFHRLLSKRARLYTEMIASPALVHGNRARLLGYEKGVNPVALQLGGSGGARPVREMGGRGWV